VLRYIFGLRVFDARFGNIDFERVVGQGIGIEHADRLICISLRGHGHKGEALRHASALVLDELHRRDGSSLREQGIDFILCGRLGQVSYVNSNIHFITSFSGTAGNKNDRSPYKWVGGQTYDRDPVIYYSFSVTQFPFTDAAINFQNPADGIGVLIARTAYPFA